MRLADDVKKIIESLMPGKFIFHPHNNLEKVIDHILGRASNQPQNCREYVKLCIDIFTQLPNTWSKTTFGTKLMLSVQQRFIQLIECNDQKMKVRLGTMRFFGEMYRMKNLYPTLLQSMLDRMLESPLPLQRELFELISVTGYPFVEPGSESKTTESKSLDIQCPICLEDVIAKFPVSTLCGHIFCETCMKGYLKDDEKPKCPVCKKLISKD